MKGGIQVSSITVAQRAAIAENTVGPVEDDKLFEPGETFILFLTPALPHEGNFYWITGVSQGAFKVEKETVNSHSVISRMHQIGIEPKLGETSLKTFLSTIKEKIN